MDVVHITTSQSITNNSLKSKILNKNKDISALSKNKYKLFILPDIDKNKYKYTLILSLNEILIYFDKSICNYMIRPGLFDFLKEMKESYELILYTTNFSDYEEQIIESIQNNNNYFEYILNRKNGFDNANSFIQDLVSLNRNLKQFIIIDTTLNKFKAYKNNILTIKPFYGDIRNDKNTLSYLSQLLQRIRIDVDSSEDIRVSINKYKKSFIYSKIAK
jgi:TFIIF-interacting CTD phosphatase-like protein